MVQALCRRNGTSPYSRSGSTKAELAAYRSPAHFIEGCAANHILPPLRITGLAWTDVGGELLTIEAAINVAIKLPLVRPNGLPETIPV